MSWKIEYVPERATVVVTGWGEIRNEEARTQVAEVIRLLKENQAKSVLVDYSDALSELTLPELYWLAEQASTVGLPWNVRVAMVLPATRYQLETYQFFELVFRNAGYDVRLFVGREEAGDWLNPPSPACAQEKQYSHS